MGLTPLWRLRAAVDPDPDPGGLCAPPPAETPRREAAAGRIAGFPEAAIPEAAPSPDVPRPGPAFPANTASLPAGMATELPAARCVPDVATLDWQALEEAIRACRGCALCEQRTQAVPGVGDRSAPWMFVGEGPGVEEDRRGEPFVGPAGRLLDNMLAALGLRRGDGVYIANAVKCRPPRNRTPEAAEIAVCLPFLDRQIALVRPRLLVALGRPAAQALLGREIAIAAARGKRFERDGVAVVVTYHPAYLLRNPLDKGKAWEDLCFARRLMAAGED
ncbi:MAG: uracil-DNA glycosylase [Azoarcus sp.]|jgi:DNA polymerase|nr:uracil-DNA glycosylase [Azoarcus sp.]